MLCPPSREHELTTANSGLILHLIFSAYTQISNYGPATRHWLLKERPSDIQQPSRRCRSCRRRSYPELGWERRDRARLEREIGRQKKVSFFRSRCFFLQPSQANLLPLFLHLNRLRDSTLLSLALTSRSAFRNGILICFKVSLSPFSRYVRSIVFSKESLPSVLKFDSWWWRTPTSN